MAVMLIEAVGIVSAIAYLGLQIYYGIAFHVNPVNLMMNLVFMILVYVGLDPPCRLPGTCERIDKGGMQR